MWKVGVSKAEDSNKGEMGTAGIEQQLKNSKKEKEMTIQNL